MITLADGSKTCFIGSANESRAAWQMNYEIIWEDTSPAGVAWVQEEFNALWNSPQAVPLAEFVVEDLARLANRRVIHSVHEWIEPGKDKAPPNPAPVVVESPVYRREAGLWEHQKYFVKLVMDAHHGPMGKARFILADQVGLGKTLQLAMSALLIALTGKRPILVICPKTLLWQWQDEMRDLLDMPSAVWNGKQWVDEQEIKYPAEGPQGILKCPRRVGIVSSGLVTRRSEAAQELLRLTYDCVILDEAHRARRRNLGENRDAEHPDPNNLLSFMYEIAERTRSLLLATATPVQLRPVEAWDLLDVLSRGDESVLGNQFSRWRHPEKALPLIMGRSKLPSDLAEQWEWVRNPMPPKKEHRDFAILRSKLDVSDECAVIPGEEFNRVGPPERQRISNLFPRFVRDHNPFIRRIVRRTRTQLEKQFDPETGEPFLKRIEVKLFGEEDRDAIILPPYLREAYQLAERFCEKLGWRMQGSGFLKTLLLRRVGSSIYSGLRTAEKLLAEWEDIEIEEDSLLEDYEGDESALAVSRTLTPDERKLLEQFVDTLRAGESDPKYETVRKLLLTRGWLERGCVVFSQYRDSIKWLAEQLTQELPDELIVLYSGPQTSGLMHGGEWVSRSREELKRMVSSGRVRLMLGTDAASEGLNLQRLSTLINLDLPWNPTRLEQRKGRIQRIGQIHDAVWVYNMRYKDSVEDRVHQLLSSRFQDIYSMFGQLPDVLEDVWVNIALGERERAKKIIDQLPKSHPFEVRYTQVEKVDWESCSEVLETTEKKKALLTGWRSNRNANTAGSDLYS